MKEKYYVRVNDIQPEVRSGGRHSYPLIMPNISGNTGFAMGYHELAPGSEGGPLHTHDGQVQEAFFFTKGKGVVTVDGVDYPIEQNVAAWAPPGIAHKITNTGTETLCFIWIYSPPKPEQL